MNKLPPTLYDALIFVIPKLNMGTQQCVSYSYLINLDSKILLADVADKLHKVMCGIGHKMSQWYMRTDDLMRLMQYKSDPISVDCHECGEGFW